MGLFDKLKNVFTEEVEEEPIKKEVRQVEIKGPTEVEKEVVVEEKKEEKFPFPVYFDDKDFDELKPKPKEVKKEVPKKETYGVKVKEVKKEIKFTPSPVISPVYGVLNKNYNKEDVIDKKVTRTEYRSNKAVTLDDIRKKAYGSLEDDLESSLFSDDPIYVEKEEILEVNPTEIVEEKIINNYKPEPLEELDENMTLDELNKLEDGLEEPITEEKEEIKMNESDLFNLIDSMYEKSDENDS